MELIVENIDKSFQKVHAVQNMNFILKPGIHALLGPNGSGKSTLMKIICGILKSEGNIYLDEIDAKQEYELYANCLGYLPQQFGYYPHYTVKEFLEYMCVVKGMSREYGRQRIQYLVNSFHLENKLDTKMKSLSGGMIRRVGIIQALLNEPKLLVLDEPTVGLDPKERMNFLDFISDISQSTIVLLSTHIVSDIESISDGILVMKDGQLIARGCYEELIRKIDGKVWKVTVDVSEGKKLMKRYRIVKSHQHHHMMNLRIICDKKPHLNAQYEEPDLNDLYMYYFAGEEHYEDTFV